MRAEPKKVTVDGQDYTLGQWSIDKSAETLAWIFESFGPAFKDLYSGVKSADETKSELELGLHFLDIVSRNISSVLSPKEYAAKLRELASDLLVDNKPVIYQNHFVGKLVHLHKVIFEVLKYQYQDFFDGALEMRGQ